MQAVNQWLLPGIKGQQARSQHTYSLIIRMCLFVFVSRIVVYGDDMLQAVVPNSAKSFNFQKKYKLSDEQVWVGISIFFFF